MSSIASPYGLKAVNLIGGLPYAGSTRSFLIDPAGLASNIFYGQVVAVNAAGYLTLMTATGADGGGDVFTVGTVGVFVGCSFVNAQGQIMYSQYYPSGTTGVVSAMVVDDDRAVFQVQANGSMAQTHLGSNVFFAAAQSTSTGSTTTGNSTSAVSATSQTATAAFRIVGFVNMVGFAVVGDAYTDLLVKFTNGTAKNIKRFMRPKPLSVHLKKRPSCLVFLPHLSRARALPSLTTMHRKLGPLATTTKPLLWVSR